MVSAKLKTRRFEYVNIFASILFSCLSIKNIDVIEKNATASASIPHVLISASEISTLPNLIMRSGLIIMDRPSVASKIKLISRRGERMTKLNISY
jgi:hypothetical protein